MDFISFASQSGILHVPQSTLDSLANVVACRLGYSDGPYECDVFFQEPLDFLIILIKSVLVFARYGFLTNVPKYCRERLSSSL